MPRSRSSRPPTPSRPPTSARAPRRRWYRKVLSGVISVLVYLVLLMVSIMGAYNLPWVYGGISAGGRPAPMTDAGGATIVGMMLLSLGIFWRRSRPWLPFSCGVIIACGLQLDALLVFVATSEIIARRRGRQPWVATALAGAIGIFVTVRNAQLPVSWLYTMDPRLQAQPTATTIIDVVLTAAAYGLLLAIGWVRHNRAEADQADARADRAETDVRDLTDQLNQRSERERLAREIHDALAHRLSLVSLHSGALEEAARSGDSSVSEAAQVVRDNAHRSLEDLRDLIGALRNSGPAGPVEQPARIPLHGMADVAEVIDSTLAAGVTVNAFVMLSDPGAASDLLNRAVFRIVQEALTNVVKHAPGSTVGLNLRASPEGGVALRIRNQLGAQDSGVPGSGSGVIGMKERVAALGGRISVGPTSDGWYEVDVQLPWQGVGQPESS